MPSFGKVHVSTLWVIVKALMIAMSALLLVTPLIWLGVPILIYFLYSIVHEFIHLAAIKLYGGNMEKIFLGYPLSHIDFQMPSIDTERAVFGWGAFADIILMLLISFSLFHGSEVTGNNLLFALGVLFIIVFCLTELLPEHSDLQEYSKRIQKI
jgi:hypothetical protein